MTILPPCPKCKSEFTYEDRDLFVCPECAHEWSMLEEQSHEQDEIKVRDANGNTLIEGDFVSVIKDLKVRGASAVVKVGTKVKVLRLTDGDHNIDCRIDGIGEMQLKSEFVKKL